MRIIGFHAEAGWLASAFNDRGDSEMRDTQEAIRRVMTTLPKWVSIYRYFKRTEQFPAIWLADRIREEYRAELPETDWPLVADKVVFMDI